jgi:hypothetical protein
MYRCDEFEIDFTSDKDNTKCLIVLTNSDTQISDVESLTRIVREKNLTKDTVYVALKQLRHRVFYCRKDFMNNLYYELGVVRTL